MKVLLEKLANNKELKASEKSIEQKQRNTIKRELTEALGQLLGDAVAGSNVIEVYRTEKGIMMGIDHPTVGIIPIEFSVAIKNLDCDPMEEEEAYLEKLQAQQEKKEKQEAAKAKKLAQQAQIKAAKERVHELQRKAN